MIESFSEAKVIAITINHEQMTDEEIERAVIDYEMQLNLAMKKETRKNFSIRTKS